MLFCRLGMGMSVSNSSPSRWDYITTVRVRVRTRQGVFSSTIRIHHVSHSGKARVYQVRLLTNASLPAKLTAA